jgi:hypothetical protein
VYPGEFTPFSLSSVARALKVMAYKKLALFAHAPARIYFPRVNFQTF